MSDSINALGDGDLAAYKSDGNPAEYLDTYKALLAFVDKSLDAYKVCFLKLLLTDLNYQAIIYKILKA